MLFILRLGNGISSRNTSHIEQHIFSPPLTHPLEWVPPELGILQCKVIEGTWVKQVISHLFSIHLLCASGLCPSLYCKQIASLVPFCSSGISNPESAWHVQEPFLPPGALPRPLELDIVVPFWKLLYTETHWTGKQRSYYLTEPCSWECGRWGEKRGRIKGDRMGRLVAELWKRSTERTGQRWETSILKSLKWDEKRRRRESKSKGR